MMHFYIYIEIRVEVKYDTNGQSIIQEVDGSTKCTDISKTLSIYQTYHTNILSFPDQAEEGPMELPGRKLKDVSHDLRVGREITTDSEWSPKPIQETPSRFVTQQQLILQRYNNMIGTVGDGFRAFYRLGVPSAAPFTVSIFLGFYTFIQLIIRALSCYHFKIMSKLLRRLLRSWP